MNTEFTKPLKVSDWVLIKELQSTSRVVDIKYMPEGYFVYGVLDLVERIHYFTADELVKLVEER